MYIKYQVIYIHLHLLYFLQNITLASPIHASTEVLATKMETVTGANAIVITMARTAKVSVSLNIQTQATTVKGVMSSYFRFS